MGAAIPYQLHTVTAETEQLAEQIARLDKRMSANLEIDLAKCQLARHGLRLVGQSEPGRYVRVTTGDGRHHTAWYRCAPMKGALPMP